MPDSDLAEIYGYETKNFNRRVKNNIVKFDKEDFMFRQIGEELENLRCKNFTSNWGDRDTSFCIHGAESSVPAMSGR